MRVGTAADCNGRAIHPHDRVELEIDPDRAGVVEKIELYGDAPAWVTVRMDNGERLLIESWRLDGPR